MFSNIYNYASSFNQGFAMVRKDTLYGLIDNNDELFLNRLILYWMKKR
nr:hypothetical protein [Bacteroidota bacterium]